MSIFDAFKLDGKRMFITGGSRGLGREMALAIADAGADVVLTGRDKGSLEKTAADIEALGRRAMFIQADMADPAECQSVCETVIEEHGPIDILINNIGGRRQNVATEDMPLEVWQELINLNLTATFICTKIIGGEMIKRGDGGRIINTASINAFVAGKNIAGRHYETGKAAVVQFTRATAADWAVHRITVNAICPGLFMTEPNQKWAATNPEIIDQYRKSIPMGDYGNPPDLGPLAVYLASDASGYMTGACLVIDGGYTLY